MSIEKTLISEINTSLSTTNIPIKLIEALFQYSQTNQDKFFSFLVSILSQSLSKYKKSKKVSVLLQILKTLIERLKSALDPSKAFEKFFGFILNNLDTKDQNPRLGYCLILDYLLPLEKWNFDILTHFQNKLKERTYLLLQDRCPCIRNLAINVAVKLNMSKEILNTTCKDFNKETRLKSLLYVYCDVTNVEVFSEHLDDIDEEVRMVVVKKIVEFGLDRVLGRVLKRIIVRYGEERSKKVKFQIKSSLNGHLNKIGLACFLDKLDLFTFAVKEQSVLVEYIQDYLRECEKTVLFDNIKYTYLPFIIQKSEQVEEILSAVLYIEALHNQDPYILHDLIDPSSIFSLFSYAHPIIPQFFIYSITRIALCLDIHEELIRSQLVSFLLQNCKSFPLSINPIKSAKSIEESYFKLQFSQYFFVNHLDLIKFSIRTVRILVQQHIHEFPNMISEIISEIREPLEGSEDQISLLKTRNVLRIKLDMLDDEIQALDSECGGSQRYLRDIKLEIEKKNEEACKIELEIEEIDKLVLEKIYRSLVIVTEMLKELKHGVLILDFVDFINNLVLAALDKDEEVLQIAAYECLTQCIIHSLELLPTYQYLYSLVFRFSDTYLEYVAIISLFDIYMVHKPEQTFNFDEGLHDNILVHVLKYSKSPNHYIQAITLEGFCKLIINNHIDSAIVLSILIFSYIDINQEPCIKQNLQVFFNNLDITIEKHSETVLIALKVFLSVTCENLKKTEDVKSIDLSTVDVKKIFDFVWSKFDKQHKKVSYELDLVYFYFSEILARPTGTESQIYSRLACRLNVVGLGDSELGFIFVYLQKILDLTRNEHLVYMNKKISEISVKALSQANFKHYEQILRGNYNKTLQIVQKFKSMFLNNNKDDNFISSN